MAIATPGDVLKRLRDAAGNSLVEAALITPLLLLLTFSIADFASLFYVYLALENGISQATRYAITGNVMEDPDNEGEQLSREESIKLAMREATPTLTLTDDAFTFQYLPDGEDTWVDGTGEPGDILKARVDYTWDIMTPLIRPFFSGGQIQLRVESAMKNEGRFE
jgi:Flp pilus assembly protein TadG